MHILSSAFHSVEFVKFMQQHYELITHKFVYVRPDVCKYGLSEFKEVVHVDSPVKTISLLYKMHKAERIILHGLWRKEVISLLYHFPWLLKKCYWLLWGGDFCLGKESYSKEHSYVIQNVGYLVGVKGDCEEIKKSYQSLKANFIFIKNFYPANTFYGELKISDNRGKTIILVGNSADKLNCHKEIFEKLLPFNQENIEIICPLSYGSEQKYIENIVVLGNQYFGSKFKPLLYFMPPKEYYQMLEKVDIAVFAHKNQQAFGNLVALLGMGKKVYMRKTSAWDTFDDLGVKLFDYEGNFSLEAMELQDAVANYKIIKKEFSLQEKIKEYYHVLGEYPKNLKTC